MKTTPYTAEQKKKITATNPPRSPTLPALLRENQFDQMYRHEHDKHAS